MHTFWFFFFSFFLTLWNVLPAPVSAQLVPVPTHTFETQDKRGLAPPRPIHHRHHRGSHAGPVPRDADPVDVATTPDVRHQYDRRGHPHHIEPDTPVNSDEIRHQYHRRDHPHHIEPDIQRVYERFMDGILVQSPPPTTFVTWTSTGFPSSMPPRSTPTKRNVKGSSEDPDGSEMITFNGLFRDIFLHALGAFRSAPSAFSTLRSSGNTTMPAMGTTNATTTQETERSTTPSAVYAPVPMTEAHENDPTAPLILRAPRYSYRPPTSSISIATVTMARRSPSKEDTADIAPLVVDYNIILGPTAPHTSSMTRSALKENMASGSQVLWYAYPFSPTAPHHTAIMSSPAVLKRAAKEDPVTTPIEPGGPWPTEVPWPDPSEDQIGHGGPKNWDPNAPLLLTIYGTYATPIVVTVTPENMVAPTHPAWQDPLAPYTKMVYPADELPYVTTITGWPRPTAADEEDDDPEPTTSSRTSLITHPPPPSKTPKPITVLSRPSSLIRPTPKNDVDLPDQIESPSTPHGRHMITVFAAPAFLKQYAPWSNLWWHKKRCHDIDGAVVAPEWGIRSIQTFGYRCRFWDHPKCKGSMLELIWNPEGWLLPFPFDRHVASFVCPDPDEKNKPGGM